MENEIKEFFHAAAPRPGDPTAFGLELNARLAAAERIKQFHDRESKRLRRLTLGLFAAGLLLGGALAALFILRPIPLPDFLALPDLTAAADRSAGTGLLKNAPLLAGIIPDLPRYLLWTFAAIPLALLAIILPLTLTRHRRSF